MIGSRRQRQQNALLAATGVSSIAEGSRATRAKRPRVDAAAAEQGRAPRRGSTARRERTRDLPRLARLQRALPVLRMRPTDS